MSGGGGRGTVNCSKAYLSTKYRTYLVGVLAFEFKVK